ncbi:RNA polymerase [Alkalihalobacillus alcalophilus ATCC 27647 = CGMCC 1.3604]|uniref:RNA polymerase n=1 Tax=Alkalihalobacillus alcalophilus ATCC 27647 = CGMCC 1.3604 TaxID=1218173 RepID=A0A094WIM4_ALKAL|nr:sigma-70 family RNA polymerase sigma factor [Alkalihalobacillus alcalophilus]KGA97649.1 RNA polymerase [Alkalihalobacillus alcalophilus ATCC 27647 = CGMCC 1.3604]MED1561316.1 sigma-70 family RNA polymerase sigma factor [Alkalihalobacillus alcalophilus]THG91479.1 RNA polymerase [Alkalihalobacillus alcalophilus ATCC 27647 = CGMCC 1.3604]
MKLKSFFKKEPKPKFEELIKTEQERMYRVAYSFVKNEQDALDIVQDAVIKAYRSYDKLTEIQYFSTWMTRILINTAIDATRRRREVIYVDFERTVSEKNEQNDTLNKMLVDEQFDRLKPEQKSLIILRFYYGYSIKEMSELLQKPEGTIKSKLHRTLTQMKINLEKGGDMIGKVWTEY